MVDGDHLRGHGGGFRDECLTGPGGHDRRAFRRARLGGDRLESGGEKGQKDESFVFHLEV